MGRSFKFKNESVLLLIIFIFILVSSVTMTNVFAGDGEKTALAKENTSDNGSQTEASGLESVHCQPDTGWVWAVGSDQPETASSAQEALAQAGIDAIVQATSIGETDSCGKFVPYAIDFELEFHEENPSISSNQTAYFDKIESILVAYGQPQLGNVKIKLASGEIVHLNKATQIDSKKVSTATTQVNAALPWQATGIIITATEEVEIAVTSGQWTHWLGQRPYNNGIGEDYICANIMPADQCTEPLPEARKGSLIGQVGTHIFAIGSSTTLNSPQSGELYLRINDEDAGLFDNDGVLTVTVSISEPPPPPPPLDGSERKVYVVVYDPQLSSTYGNQLLSDYMNWYDHATLTQGTINFFTQASDNELTYAVVATTTITDGWPIKVDGFRYTESEYLNVMEHGGTPHSPDAVDYNAIVNDPDLDICGKANRNEIDEVWIYNGPYFGFYESTLVGPGAYWYNSPPVPGPHDCNRLIPIMGPSPERGVDSAVHNFGHRTESAMRQVYGSWEQNRTAHSWEQFALVDALSPDYDYSGCGNTHYPPNGTSDYDYTNNSTADTNCADFANYPDLNNPADVIEPVTCTTWGCNGVGYYDYWFSHLPANFGCGPDDVSSNWWPYIYEPAKALNPSSLCQYIFLPSIFR